MFKFNTIFIYEEPMEKGPSLSSNHVDYIKIKAFISWMLSSHFTNTKNTKLKKTKKFKSIDFEFDVVLKFYNN
jgi:hypothetical protein